MIRWNVQSIRIQPGVEEDILTLSEALGDGWEPFAAAATVAGHIYYLRKSYRLP